MAYGGRLTPQTRKVEGRTSLISPEVNVRVRTLNAGEILETENHGWYEMCAKPGGRVSRILAKYPLVREMSSQNMAGFNSPWMISMTCRASRGLAC